jgi:hypothetical protein
MKTDKVIPDLLDRQFLHSFHFEYGMLDDGKVWIALPDNHIFQVDSLTLRIILDINAGNTIKEASEKYDIEASQIEFLVRNISEHGGIIGENRGRVTRATLREDVDIAGDIMLLFIMTAFQFYYFMFHSHTFLMTKISEGVTVAVIAFIAVFFHEAGHFFFTWHFTRERPKAGFEINLIFPVIYVNTQNAWRLPKNKRFIVNTGGIFFDLVINTFAVAAVFTYPALEYYVTPFLLTQYMRWSLLLNPLFKGDGYWILADISGVVNMEKKGMEELKNMKFSPLSLFGILSIVFSVVSVVGLAWFVFNLAGSAIRGIIGRITFIK